MTHYFERIKQMKPISRQDLIEKVSRILGGSIHEVVDTHNTKSVIFIYSLEGNTCLLKMEYGTDTATHGEIKWYTSSASSAWPTKVSLVHAHSDLTFAAIVLEYLEESKTLDDLVFDGEHRSPTRFILHAMERDQELFDKSSVPADHTTVDAFFMKKFERRLAEAVKTPYLKKIMVLPRLKVNGTQMLTPTQAVSKIKDDRKVHEYLTPERLGFIHGDLHCGNILVKDDSIYCIDPNGKSLLPIEYDYGKLLHSIHGGYGAIMTPCRLLCKSHGEGISATNALALTEKRGDAGFCTREQQG